MPGVGGVTTLAVPPGFTDPHNYNPPGFQPVPAGQGVTAWNLNAQNTTAGTVSVSGAVQLIRIQLQGAPFTFSNVQLGITTAGATLTAGQNFAGVYDDQGNLLGASADQSALWTSTGLKVMALTGAPFTGWWQFLYVAYVANGTTPPVFARFTQNTALAALSAAGSALAFAQNGSGATSLPATVSYGSNTTTNQIVWAGLS